jgi:hypothetical protein
MKNLIRVLMCCMIVSSLLIVSCDKSSGHKGASLKLTIDPSSGYADTDDYYYFYWYFNLTIEENNNYDVQLTSLQWDWYYDDGSYAGGDSDGCATMEDMWNIPGCYLEGGGSYTEYGAGFWSTQNRYHRLVLTITGEDEKGKQVTASDEYKGYPY